MRSQLAGPEGALNERIHGDNFTEVDVGFIGLSLGVLVRVYEYFVIKYRLLAFPSRLQCYIRNWSVFHADQQLEGWLNNGTRGRTGEICFDGCSLSATILPLVHQRVTIPSLRIQGTTNKRTTGRYSVHIFSQNPWQSLYNSIYEGKG